MIDYGFSAIQLLAPIALGLNKKAQRSYQSLGTGFLAMNAVTKTSVGLKPLISFKEHQKADLVFLAGLAGLSFFKSIRKSRLSLGFHLGFLAVAMANYLLTDYNNIPAEDAVIIPPEFGLLEEDETIIV